MIEDAKSNRIVPTGTREVKVSITERLKREREQLRSRLAELDDVIEKLERNPQFQDLIDSLSRITHF